MRRIAVSAVALTATMSIAAVAPSYAQTPDAKTTITVKPSVSPTKAGTKAKPRSVNLGININWKTAGPDGSDKPIVQKLVIDFPKGSLYLGGKYPSCTEAKLNQGLPKEVCPKAIVGKGTGLAWADTAKTKPKFTLVNGGASKMFLYTELTNPAVVNSPVPGVVKKGGKYGGYRLTLTVPQELQVVAGTPISLISANVKTNAKNWLATTSCPKNGKWPYQVISSQDSTADAVFASTVKCTS
ncbi:hypothetical protein [Patulibacter minatonensis]|uniref:hypothetical protein n=1 Tax=Patulibacter minatonensis TaxID=298163 RepID=UPI00047A7DCC|nr:hypothetical protein [Patulibacter minatonensis]